jgi:hypothetical protein
MQVDKLPEQAKPINEETTSRIPPDETGEVWEAPQLEKYGSLEKLTLQTSPIAPPGDILP